jgi:hypothetical protein
MPFQKGHTKFGGRRKGTDNRPPGRQKVRQVNRLVFADEFQAALVKEFSPLEVMHAIMLLRVSKGDYDGALSAAEKAAPYCHARLNATDVKVQHSISGKSDAELTAEIETIRQKLELVRPGMALFPLIEANAEAVPVEFARGSADLSRPDCPTTEWAPGNE